MFLIIAVLAVFIADICCGNPTLQKYKTTNEIRPEHNCTAVSALDKGCARVLIFDPEMRSAFKLINENWIVNPRWDENIAVEALKEASKQHTTQADYKIVRTEKFDKGSRSETSMAEKVEVALAFVCPFWLKKDTSLLPRLLGRESLRQCHLPSSAYYGCNGIFDTTGKDEDVLTVACLYYKHKWTSDGKRKYKNIEI